ncbi:MAG: manganese efflux pump [Lentisphaerae bacterium]|nr:manganese efflux pump [Lentisphaerota bacterium]
MSLTPIILVAVGLAMDALAIATVSGMTITTDRLFYAFRMSVFFGVFQAVMPLFGWLAGIGCCETLERISHWLAFGLLAFIGGKMIYESYSRERNFKSFSIAGLASLLVLSFATSIDAFAVGFSFSLLNKPIIVSALIIGVITFCISLLGFFLGAGCETSLDAIVSKVDNLHVQSSPQLISENPCLTRKRASERIAEFLGGFILVCIGMFLLASHIF